MDEHEKELAAERERQRLLKERRERYKKRENARTIEYQQKRERKTLTKDNALAKKKRPGRRGSVSAHKKRKQAPGRKSTKKKPRKAEARVETARKQAHNEAVRLLKGVKEGGSIHPSMALAVRADFCQYLKGRMSDDDVTNDDWLDWIEGEVERLRSELRVHNLYPRE